MGDLLGAAKPADRVLRVTFNRPETFNSVDGGNNFRWFLGVLPYEPPVPLPLDSAWMLMLMALAMVVLGVRRFRFRW